MKNIIEKYKNMSFSEAAEAIGKKWKNKDIDLIEKNSYNQELETLAQYQEKKKMVSQMQDAVKQFKKGGVLPKYAGGGGLGNPTDGLAMYLKQLNQTGLDAGNNLSQGLIGMNADYNSSKNLMSTPEMLPQVNNVGSMQIPSNPFVSKTTMNSDVVSGITEESNPFKFQNAEGFQTLTNPNVSTEPTNTRGEMSAYTPALLGQGVSTALNLGILAGGYDKVAPVDNPYESQVIRNMADRGIDTTQQRNQILSAYNAAKDNLSNTRSANVRNALDVNMMNTTQDSLAESKMQEQQLNNNYQGEYANVLNNLGQQKVQAQTYAEQLNSQSKSNFQSEVSGAGKHLADIGLSQTTLKLNNVQQTAIANIMSQKYPDFVIGDDALKSYLTGTYTDEEFVKLKQAATKHPELQSVLDFATFQKQQKENKG